MVVAYLRRKLDEAVANKVAPHVAALVTELGEALVAESAVVRLGAGVHSHVDLELALVPEPLRADRAVELEELARMQPDLVRAQGAKVPEILWTLIALERPEVLVDALVRRQQAALPELLRAGPGRRRAGGPKEKGGSGVVVVLFREEECGKGFPGQAMADTGARRWKARMRCARARVCVAHLVAERAGKADRQCGFARTGDLGAPGPCGRLGDTRHGRQLCEGNDGKLQWWVHVSTQVVGPCEPGSAYPAGTGVDDEPRGKDVAVSARVWHFEFGGNCYISC